MGALDFSDDYSWVRGESKRRREQRHNEFNVEWYGDIRKGERVDTTTNTAVDFSTIITWKEENMQEGKGGDIVFNAGEGGAIKFRGDVKFEGSDIRMFDERIAKAKEQEDLAIRRAGVVRALEDKRVEAAQAHRKSVERRVEIESLMKEQEYLESK